MRTPTRLFQIGFALNARVATVCIHVPAGIVRVEQVFKDGGVSDSGIRDDDFANYLVTLVDACMEFVAEMVLAMFFGPLRIDILLRPLVGRPCRWHDALFDDLSFLALVALHGRLHQRGIDDLAATGLITLRQQLLLYRINNCVPNPAWARRSRNSQIVFASGIVLLSVSPRNCRKLRRSSN